MNKNLENIEMTKQFIFSKKNWFAFFIGAGLLVCMFTLFGFGGDLWWILDLFAHFRLQYLLILTLLLIWVLWIKRYQYAFVFFLFAVINFYETAPYLVGSKSAFAAPGSKIRVLVSNVLTENRNYDKLEAYIQKSDPDIILLVEADAIWLENLQQLGQEYPYRVSKFRDDNYSILLFSRMPLKESQVVRLSESGMPAIYASIRVSNQQLSLLGVHLFPPYSECKSTIRNQELTVIAELANRSDNPFIVLGDFNITPWSIHFQRFLEESELIDSSIERSFFPTWPAGFAPFWITIDHFLYSRNIRVLAKRIGPSIGSDHYPFTVDFIVED